jgi:hypothetical protein
MRRRSVIATDARERGGAMVVAMISMVSLLGLGMVTILTLEGGMSAASNDRFKTVALYAAESGAAAGMAFLRERYTTGQRWTELVSPKNADPVAPEELPGNGVDDGEDGLFSQGSSAWYEVTILNNVADPGFEDGADQDGRVVLRSVGHGPNGATSIVELEVIARGNAAAIGRPCPGYAQRGLAEDNGGRNDCLGQVDSTIVVSVQPGS